jgi:protein-disulfide isomerase
MENPNLSRLYLIIFFNGIETPPRAFLEAPNRAMIYPMDGPLSRRISSGLLLALCACLTSTLPRLLTPPYSPRSPQYRTQGPDGAGVVLAAFSDFECGGCRGAVEPLHQLRDMFPGRIQLRFKHMPWYFHAHAKEAAIASECAGLQGAFWKYHDLLFARQQDWASSKDPGPAFERLSRESGLDVSAFKACLKDAASARPVEEDISEAKKHWIRSTPTFFVNGRRFVGTRQLRSNGLPFIEAVLRGGKR